MGLKTFFQKAFSDMKESAKAQHEADQAEFAAVKAEAKANFASAKAMGHPDTHRMRMQAEREKRIADANTRKANAEARIEAMKKNR